MKKQFLETLSKSNIFKEFSQDEIDGLFFTGNHRLKTYLKDELVGLEGEEINDLEIILEGNASVEKGYTSGKVLKLKQILQGDIIGLVSVFSDHNEYPCTTVATEKVVTIAIPQTEIIEICRKNGKFLENFLKLISNRALYLNNKLKFLSYGTIREKITIYLLDENIKQKSLTIKVELKRKEMADTFGVTRPALSNEIIRMKNEGLIDIAKGIIKIKNIIDLENQLDKVK